jgi:hypothetical protein
MRGAADVVAGQWGTDEVVAAAPDWRDNAAKGGYLFWYYEYLQGGNWQEYSQIPPGKREVVDILAKKFAADPRISSVEPED